MTDTQQREAARQFFYKWKGKGNEDEDARSYWIEILTNIFGVRNATDRMQFEKKVIGADGNTKRIDVYIPETHVLIEQKSLGIALDKPQAGHDGKTPYEQAKYYDNYLPFDERARWIITSNFTEIWIYDLNQKKPESTVVKLSLADLQTKYHTLDILINSETKKITQEMEVSLKAGEIVGELYDAFHKQYKNPNDPESLKSLNKLCVRLVFLCYAEDAGILGKKAMFHDYMEQYTTKDMRKALIELFEVLNQKPEERDQYLTDDLAAFPYVNGGLFEDETIEIPMFTDAIRELVLNKASAEFDWSGISPTIFGAVFESTLNPETRRSGGMHYTSIENIHKVIDPLFLNDLKAELDSILSIGVIKERQKKLRSYQKKLSSLTFMDPAAGSGNFLTETYISIRRLENKTIQELESGQGVLSFADPIKVSISQFYGIEINDFAVTVAKTALWIAESQMMKETEGIVHMDLDFLPLKTNANIVEGNALGIDWDTVIDKNNLNYLYGNPPFRGSSRLSEEQIKDRESLFGSGGGELDYVACWYKKAADYIKGTTIECAFVSTNSICQGQQVAPLWKDLLSKGLIINFAYRTFIWESEASLQAHVYCVIIGFSYVSKSQKWIFENDGYRHDVDHINGYLIDAEDIFIEKRRKPLCNDVPCVIKGFQPTDNGNLVLSDEEKDELLKVEPAAEKWIRPFITAKEYINGKNRWCLWLTTISASELKSLPHVMDRVKKCGEWRQSQKKSGDAYKLRDIPMLMRPSSQFKEGNFIILPRHTGERRRYVPFGFSENGAIPGDSISLAPAADLYHFGVLCSNVHMAWMRAVCGRLKGDYRYTSDIVYNNFVWPSVSDAQRSEIEKTAKMILDARERAFNNDSKNTLADLYDPITMPIYLRKAHTKNDAAVMKAYGMPIQDTDEAACVAWLMRLYQNKVSLA